MFKQNKLLKLPLLDLSFVLTFVLLTSFLVVFILYFLAFNNPQSYAPELNSFSDYLSEAIRLSTGMFTDSFLFLIVVSAIEAIFLTIVSLNKTISKYIFFINFGVFLLFLIFGTTFLNSEFDGGWGEAFIKGLSAIPTFIILSTSLVSLPILFVSSDFKGKLFHKIDRLDLLVIILLLILISGFLLVKLLLLFSISVQPPTFPKV